MTVWFWRPRGKDFNGSENMNKINAPETEITNDYLSGNYTFKELAAKYSCAWWIIQRVARQHIALSKRYQIHALNVARTYKKRNDYIPIKQKYKTMIKDFLTGNYSYNTLAAKHNICRDTAQKVISKFVAKPTRLQILKTHWYPNSIKQKYKNRVIKAYLTAQYTQLQIAKKHGITHSMVNQIICDNLDK